MKIVSGVFILMILSVLALLVSCGANQSTLKQQDSSENLVVNDNANGPSLNITLKKGRSHNHPSFVIWAEDMDENFIQTLFVTRSIATGIFGHGPLEAEKWDTKPGWQKRPAALPYWIHRRKPIDNGPQLPDPDHPVPDAYTGATPLNDLNLETRLDNSPVADKIRILMEINQPWDWNDYWTNELHDDPDYRTSCQPSLIFAVTIDLNEKGKEYHLNAIGHGHYSGKNGELYTDLSTITSAKDIFRTMMVSVNE